jgi:hypothetical protein
MSDGMSLHGSGMAVAFVDANQFLTNQHTPKSTERKDFRI